MTSKIEQLAELKIDRDDEPPAPKRGLFLLVAIAIAIVVGIFSYRVLSNRAIEVEVHTVRVAQPGTGSGSVLDASGYVVARRQATVSSEISGKVLKVLVEEGMVVESDQIVAYLEDSTQKAYLALAEAELVSARARLQETRALITQAELDLERSEELSKRDLISDSELDAARANEQALQARLIAGQEGVNVARRNVDVSRDQLDNTIIRAPFAGVVVSKNAQPGEIISPNSAGGGFTRTGICTIVDMESLEIEVDVNEAYIQRVKSGQRVTATLDAYPDWKIPAAVIAIVPTADRQKATVRVRIGFVERDDRILRDMGVKVAFLENRETDTAATPPRLAVYIPQEALNTDSDGNFVWIARDNAAVRRAISIGQRSGRGVQVMSGLGAGDNVVTSARAPLEAGAKIVVLNNRRE